jgi:putative transport protein
MFEWLKILFSPSIEPEMTQSLIVLFLAISLGFFVGKIRFGKISLGVSVVLFVGLFLGHFGFTMNADLLQFVREFGLILFVYGIGIQVEPTFFSSFKKEGLVFNALGIGTVLLGGIITYLIHLLVNMKIENAVGFMSGSVTNTPGLGAAKTTLIEIQKQLKLPSDHFADPAIAYAITYAVGF